MWPLRADFPSRSLLFVPGVNPEMIRKSWSKGADAIILDLEDSVLEPAKPQARENVRKALEVVSEKGPLPLVRINAHSTPHWKLDLEAVAGRNLRGVVIPKCDSVQGVKEVERVVRQREKKLRLQAGSTPLFLLIESAKGLLDAPLLLSSSRRIGGVIFGAEDFCADVGTVPTDSGNELLYARCHLVACARAYGCVAIDSARSDFQDLEGLRREAETSRRLGFAGKLAVHPRQVGVLNAAFTPAVEELANARTIVQASLEAQARGSGVAALNGRMIDNAVVARAKRVIAAWELSRREEQS